MILINKDNKYKIAYEIIFTLLAIIAVIITLLDLTENINLSNNDALNTFDTAITYIFIFDYAIRLIFAKSKRDFFKTNIPDLIAIIPFNSLFKVFRIAKLLRLAKLTKMTKLFKLFRFVGVLARLNKKIKGVLKTNGLNHALWFTLVVILLSAIGIYVAEPETVKTFDTALWWSFVTATTVGYGDIFPTSSIGRMIAGILMLTGIGTIGMITGSISTYFMTKQNVKTQNNDISEIMTQSKDLTDDEINEILNYINYVKSKRKDE